MLFHPNSLLFKFMSASIYNKGEKCFTTNQLLARKWCISQSEFIKCPINLAKMSVIAIKRPPSCEEVYYKLRNNYKSTSNVHILQIVRKIGVMKFVLVSTKCRSSHLAFLLKSLLHLFIPYFNPFLTFDLHRIVCICVGVLSGKYL